MDSVDQSPIIKKPKLNCSGSGFAFESLPKDLLHDILSRLPITSLIQFRFVCRSCYDMSHDPDLSWLHYLVGARADPTLMFHSDYPICNQLSFVGDDNIVRKITTPFCSSMPEYNVVGSCNGLLCLADSLYTGETVYVFNPFTRTCLKLPTSKHFQDEDVFFGFGFHPVTNEYKVVRIVYYRTPFSYPKSEVHVLTIGSNSSSGNCWRCLGNVLYQLDGQAKEVVVVNGRLHWVSRPTRRGRRAGRVIVSFDLKDEQFKMVSMPDKCWSSRQLLVIDGCLGVVASCGRVNLEIWVMKEYDVKDSWTKRFVINGKYLTRATSLYHLGEMDRVLCLLKNGEILIECTGGLAKYDPKGKVFEDVVFHGMPKLFQTIVHVGSLN